MTARVESRSIDLCDEPTASSERDALVLPMGRRAPAQGVFEVIEAEHPILHGRVACALTAGETPTWLPTLSHLSIRKGDRVLVSQPENFAESVVIGVIDGFAPRARPLAERGATLMLKPDEALVIETSTGAPLVEIRRDASGARVRVLARDLAMETEGRLTLSAETIAIESRAGNVEIRSSDDVVVEGEIIHLN